MKKIKICIALSGGIDSSVAAFLLKKCNFYIEAVFMNNWKTLKNSKCNNQIDYTNALYICNKLNIKLHFLDFSKEYWNFVFELFLKELVLGKTPNPDIICNKKIKFNVLLYFLIKKFNFDFLATGHYCCLKQMDNNIFLQKSFDIIKDQTYFLNQIKKNVIKNIIFPLSNYSKIEIREIAKKNGLINFNKKNSTGICFIGENNFFEFIKKYLNVMCGKIYTNNNIMLGYHNGLYLYTIGQRKHLSIKNNNLLTIKWYVYKKNIIKNILYVTKNNNFLLFSKKIKVSNVNLINDKLNTFVCNIKIRHGFHNTLCLVKKCKNSNFYDVFFKKKQKAISVGQYIVFYNKNVCLGGALINKVIF